MGFAVRFEKEKAYLKTANFDLVQTFECGQAFRWVCCGDKYTGVVSSKVLNMRQTGDEICLWPCTEDEFYAFWMDYFDLERDYAALIESFRPDPVLYKAACFGSGIRILKQDIWETLISFIVSSNNSIHRIKGIIKRISEKYGSRISFGGEEYYAFPKPDQLSKATIEDLVKCGAGYRAEFILKAAIKVNEGYTLRSLYNLSIEEARKELIEFSGIGQKVAECICLYSLGHMNAFPVDTWIKKSMELYYIGSACSKKAIMEQAKRLYGVNAGIAQQYLFYYARENKINEIVKINVDIEV
ncbi:MAG TPA: DNA-3-methyladenine glycosylase [Clostridia bacterium]|nr:DNA-3-methyladenine glycosylase [Clostridia bacterium]